MTTKITKTAYDGLRVASTIRNAGVYTASQVNLLQALAYLREALTTEKYEEFLQIPVLDQTTDGFVEIARGIGKEKAKRTFLDLGSHFEPFLQSTLRFSSVIDVLVSPKTGLAAVIWGTVKFVITISLDYSHLEQISKVFKKLGDLYPYFEQFDRLSPGSDKLREALADFYAISIKFCTEVLIIYKKSSSGQILNTARRHFHIVAQHIITELQSQLEIVRGEIRLALEVLAHRGPPEASLYREKNHSALTVRLAGLENFSFRQYMHVKIILPAISSYDHKPSFSKAYKSRELGTGSWLFSIPEFKEWTQKQESCGLWCYGSPVAGKTILTAGVIDYLFSHSLDRRVSICYFFCDYMDVESTQPRTILRSLISQILSVFRELPPEMENNLRATFLRNHKEPRLEELWRVLLFATRLSPTIYFVIDGLDECSFDNRNQLLYFMKKLMQESESRIKIIICSRPEVDISRSLKGYFHISLDTAKGNVDLKTYIHKTIDQKLRNGEILVCSQSLVEEIKKTLIQRSNGMFLLANLHIMEICRENNDNNILRALQSLPVGLEEQYTKILERIVRNHKPDIAKRVFTWLAVARRPLSLPEVSEAAAFNLGCLRWDQGSFQSDPLSLLQNCGNLVRHVEDGAVSFVHYSVREFLLSGRVMAEFSLLEREADLYVGRICLRYLDFPAFESQLSSSTEGDSIPATAEWVASMRQHNRRLSPLSKIGNMVAPAPTSVFTPTTAIYTKMFQRAMGTRRQATEVFSLKPSLLNYIAKNWIHHCSELPRDDEENWNLFTDLVFYRKLPFNHLPWPRLDIHNNTSGLFYKWLLWAVEADNPALLKATCNTLEAKGVPVSRCIDMRNEVGQTLTQLASARGHVLVLQELIALGANVNAEPPHEAAGGGHSNILNRTSIQAASQAGHLEILNRLIEAGANVNAEPADYGGRSALQAAAEGGHLHVVNRLLEAKADVNAKPASNHGRTALQAAAEAGHLDILNQLIKAGADADAMPAHYGGRTALQAVTDGGHFDIVNRLVEAKSDVSVGSTGYEARTALQAATRGDYSGSRDRLVVAKANADAKPARHSSAADSHLDTLNQPIESKADFTEKPTGSHSQPILQATCEDITAESGDESDYMRRFPDPQFCQRESSSIRNCLISTLGKVPELEHKSETQGHVEVVDLMAEDYADSTIPQTLEEHSTCIWPVVFAKGKTDIHFKNDYPRTRSDEAKEWIEWFIGSPINWWPLCPRRKPLPKGYVWVNWRCRCGRSLSGVISRVRMDEYNQWVRTCNGQSSAPCPQAATAIHRGSVGGSCGVSGTASGDQHLNSASGPPGNPSTATGVPVSTGPMTTKSHRFLLWCVNSKRMRTHVRNIDVSATESDAIVFQKLKTEYCNIRSWRRWFSLYVISEIRFVKFRCYRLDHVGCYPKQELPRHDDPNYDYEPRGQEPKDVPPVPVEELMEYFEDPTCAGTSANTLRYFPKRVNGKMTHRVDGGQGWGLHAREYLSIFRISVLGLSILAGTLIFVPFWLHRHPGDLQTAFVPPFFFLALTAICVVLPQLQQPLGAVG